YATQASPLVDTSKLLTNAYMSWIPKRSLRGWFRAADAQVEAVAGGPRGANRQEPLRLRADVAGQPRPRALSPAGERQDQARRHHAGCGRRPYRQVARAGVLLVRSERVRRSEGGALPGEARRPGGARPCELVCAG